MGSRIVAGVLVAMLIVGAAGVLAQSTSTQGDVSAQAVVGRAFTYQGQLQVNSQPANGAFDFRFILYDADTGGSQVGPILMRNDVSVSNGLFTVTLDFGGIFNSTTLFLDIAVRPGDSAGTYTPLVPRQPLTAVPFASAVVLPFSSSASTSGSALAITNTGSGQAAEFRSSSPFASVYVANSGTGGAFRADTSATGQGSAITGYNYGVDRYAAEFEILNSSNPRAAIYARSAGNGQAIDAEINSNTNGDALFARTTSSSASSYAGIFVGNVSISGNLAKSSGSFKIDHPLDPANKYLQHSFVESPDMMNIYNGNVTLDSNGEAVVQLPKWFEALNMEFRYQHTPLGAPGPNLYIAQEITQNEFKIAGGSAGGRVSWQVTGIRHDAYADAHRIQVEVDKPADERGTYLNPVEHGRSRALGLDMQERPLRPMSESEAQR